MYRKRLIVIGIATFVAGALISFPARVAYDWFAPQQLQLSGVSGSIWSGRATQGSAAGLYFTNLEWALHPLALLTGRLALDFRVQTPAGRIESRAAVGMTGTVSLQQLEGNLTLSAVHPALAASGIDGVLNVNMQSLVLKDGLPVEATGVVTLGNLTTRAFGSDSLGNFRADVTTGDDGIIAVVEDAGAVIDLNGTASLNDDRSYLFLGNVRSTADTPPVIQQNLRFLGSADANGQRQFRFEGAL